MRFALRHWTSILIIVLIAGWAIFYLPVTPSYAIFELKQAVDARNGSAAASYVDFKKVVENAGNEVVQNQNRGSSGVDASNIIAQLIGKSAINLLSGPMAALLQQWVVQQVNDGAPQVQMPAAAVAGAALLIHRNDGAAYTRWTDHKGQIWEVRMEREADGWKVVQVKDVVQLLEKLKRQQEKQFPSPAP
ncbi:MAG: DUF2939 domain-containing protein [Deltaproteobacteria bacterium]|nr:DUF2939 domain-containing protein [Deltaproteobacteria bacterium]MBV8451584.1 DUF2939 domain-containing protein [Deltaproteobacteria bacterium]